jgi:hypothetical protein
MGISGVPDPNVEAKLRAEESARKDELAAKAPLNEAQATSLKSEAELNQARAKGEAGRQLGDSLQTGQNMINLLGQDTRGRIGALSKREGELSDYSVMNNSQVNQDAVAKERGRIREELKALGANLPSDRQTLELLMLINPELARLLGYNTASAQ